MQDEYDGWEGPDEVVEIDDDAATTFFTSNVDGANWHHAAPFHDPFEVTAAGMVEVYGDGDAACSLSAFEKYRAVREEALRNVCLRRLSADDLRGMRDWDMACYFGDREHSCELHGCEAWYDEDGDHDNNCPWSQVLGDEMEAHGLALHRRDPTFWERLRKLGATPEVVAEANAILHPKAPKAQHSTPPRPRPCASRRRTGTRSRGRRAAPARRTATASRGSPSDDDGPSPPPELKLWRHERYAKVTPALLRVLLAVEREEAGR